MPLNTTQAAAIATNATFINRVRVAFYFIAREKLAAKTAQETQEAFDIRREEARATLLAESEQFAKYATVVITHPVIVAATPANEAAIPDVQIVDAVREAWNAMSSIGGGPF